MNKYTASYLSLGDKFRDDMGFVPRQGVDIFSATAMRRVRPKALTFIREIRPELDFSRYTRTGKGVETQTVNPTMNMDFSDGSSLSMNYRCTRVSLRFRTSKLGTKPFIHCLAHASSTIS